MMKNKKLPALLLLFCVMTALCTSCLRGAENHDALSGEREGAHFLYESEEKLLILYTENEITKEGSLLDRSFKEEVEYLFLSIGVSYVEDGAFLCFPNLKKVFCRAKPSNIANACADGVEILLNVDDFETQSYLPSGTVLGHCPEATADCCLLCSASCGYYYEDYCCYFKRLDVNVCDETLLLEGKNLHFGKDGKLEEDGFLTLGGEKRYFENGVFRTGTFDLDGVRYALSTSSSTMGVVTSEKKIDEKVPLVFILMPLAALPLGGAACFFVYRLYKKKNPD